MSVSCNPKRKVLCPQSEKHLAQETMPNNNLKSLKQQSSIDFN